MDRGIRGVLPGQALQVLPPSWGRPQGRDSLRDERPRPRGPAHAPAPGFPAAPALQAETANRSPDLPEQRPSCCVPGSPSCTRDSSPVRGEGPSIPRPRRPEAALKRCPCLPGPWQPQHGRIWFNLPGLCQGSLGARAPLFPEPGRCHLLPERAPRPGPARVALRLPLGIWQTVAQPAWQHLRLSAQSPSDKHSRVQFRSSTTLGHTPVFSAPVPGRWTVSGGLEPSPRGCPPPAPRASNLKLQGILHLGP